MAKIDFKKIVSDSTETVRSGAKKAQETIKNVDVRSAADTVRKKTEDAVSTVSRAVKKKEEIHGYITPEGAVKLMSLVIASDSVVSDEELEEIREAGKELDPKFSSYGDALISECTALVCNADPDDADNEINDYARDVIEATHDVEGATVPVKLLLWDLLAAAYCDKKYDEKEVRLIRYISRHLGVDKSIIPEMENAIRAIDAIDKEAAWLRTTDRPFSTVEPIMNELSDRRAAIMQSVHMLIND